jgi:hypothetical protein
MSWTMLMQELSHSQTRVHILFGVLQLLKQLNIGRGGVKGSRSYYVYESTNSESVISEAVGREMLPSCI